MSPGPVRRPLRRGKRDGLSDSQRARRWKSYDWSPSGIVTLLTDFGTVDPYAGIMRGVILGIAPDARLVDLTHDVPPQAVEVGSLLLRSAVEFFPVGTVHCAVVDPGVGSDRAPLVVVTDGAVLVGPDNGLLQASAAALGVREVLRIENEKLFLQPVSRTFHGRDIFAPVAAYLAAGGSPRQVGSSMPGMRSLDAPPLRADGDTVEGAIIHVDHFGNLISNIPVADIGDGGGADVEIADRRVKGLSASYADAAPGEMVAIEGSWKTLEVACNGGNAAERLGCGVGTPVIVRRK